MAPKKAAVAGVETVKTTTVVPTVAPVEKAERTKPSEKRVADLNEILEMLKSDDKASFNKGINKLEKLIKRVDPAQPSTRAASGYNLFIKDVHRKQLETDSGVKLANQMGKFGEMWTQLTEAEREEWKAKAKALKEANKSDSDVPKADKPKKESGDDKADKADKADKPKKAPKESGEESGFEIDE